MFVGALLRRHSVDPERHRGGNCGQQKQLDGCYSPYDSSQNTTLFLHRDSRSGSVSCSLD